MQAQDVCEIAFNARDRLNEARASLEQAQKEARRREEQLAKMEVQRGLSLEELRRLKIELQEAADLDEPTNPSAPPADISTGDWDVVYKVCGSSACSTTLCETSKRRSAT